MKVAKVDGHATDEVVENGGVRWQDKDGNEAADGSADLGRRRQPEHIIDAKRLIQNAFSLWYTFVCDLHRFYIAVARTVVTNDGKGGSVPYLLVRSSGAFDQKSQH